MSKKQSGISQSVRTIFDARRADAIGHAELFSLLGLDSPSLSAERNAVRDSLKWLVSCGYLEKTGRAATAAYRYSGQGMRHQKATEEELRRARRVAKGAQPKAPRVDKMTVNRARVDLRADLVPAKPWGKEKGGQRPAETVDEFKARGGQVQRLTASWEQAA
ncbi:hypothetical protein [Stenotrophomonas lactitubi]|uniref:hypothetical protein n=1 Tax=Stenotrophomonas lactitubi TaxID=2045214 RepID=UPI001D8CBEDE|nr:hypothetical protein [Stenotrophomonas lactitubi]CAH0174682.1 hypothetical protein SRABI81_01310 [Stenotrophomonas lactitubi]CAH0174941.1 hypothetical protein SRABI122_01278 [Stenotrophomonas lactitubi]CAH0193143.1 hypothetical protein SRABI102_01567 [Stenotrophomonas lactitubi]CAH0227640.1 hypothetical protein SRABI66_02606 [Stenotrophomonas lactitubi]